MAWINVKLGYTSFNGKAKPKSRFIFACSLSEMAKN